MGCGGVQCAHFAWGVRSVVCLCRSAQERGGKERGTMVSAAELDVLRMVMRLAGGWCGRVGWGRCRGYPPARPCPALSILPQKDSEEVEGFLQGGEPARMSVKRTSARNSRQVQQVRQNGGKVT